jgi:MFS family permease
MQTVSIWTRDFFGVSFSNFLQYMTHYALIAALPFFVTDVLSGDERQAGLVMTFFQIGAILCRPLAGKWMDEFPKAKVLFVALSLFLLVSVMYMGATSLLFLLVIRLLHGMIFATGTTATTTIAALIIPESRKGEGIGYFAMFISVAMVIGPFLSLTIIAQEKVSVLFGVCAGLAVLSLLCGKMTRIPQTASKAKLDTTYSFHWRSLLEPKALPMALAGCLLFFVYAGILVFIPLYAKELGLGDYASAFFAVYAISIVGSRPMVGKLFDRWGVSALIYPAIAIFGMGMVGLSQVHGPVGLLMAGAVVGAGFGALSPSFQTLAIQMSPRHRAGVATSTYFLFLDIGVGLGSLLLSIIASYTNYRIMYLAASLVVVAIPLVYYTLYQRKSIVVSGQSA